MIPCPLSTAWMDGMLCDEHNKITAPYCGWLRPQQSSFPAEMLFWLDMGHVRRSSLVLCPFPYTCSFFLWPYIGYVYSFPIVCVDVDNVFRLVLVSLEHSQRARGVLILHWFDCTGRLFCPRVFVLFQKSRPPVLAFLNTMQTTNKSNLSS